ncbi:FadR/GntR family transcriptional regulator [Corynebacterium lizhenjunii]|uniref:FadR/GntR family transcriptional regulator n=1 Tax=Corynebacterium lizhenjunii TaxID=2709394 RepID=UPI0013EBB6EC|nr:FadR/GntR family transcriptional regulator [Corynebacterium lizhenjunii]
MKRKSSANPSVLEGIKGYIRDNGLGPGQPLPTEPAFAELLGVSRSSVREAMRVLATLDIVDIRHGYGTVVGNMSLAPLVDGMLLRLTLNRADGIAGLEDIVQTRIALDKLCAPELVEHFSTHSTAALRQIVTDMARRFAQGQSFGPEDLRFHQELSAGLRNHFIRDLILALWEIHVHGVEMLGMATPDDIVNTVTAHREMVDALDAGDLEAYLASIDAHFAPMRAAIARQRAALAESADAPSADAPTAGTAPTATGAAPASVGSAAAGASAVPEDPGSPLHANPNHSPNHSPHHNPHTTSVQPTDSTEG